MIDPHVHLRDWEQSDKETLRNGMETALRSGLTGLFEMPNTAPPLTSGETVLRRIADARKVLPDNFIYGLYAGLTNDYAQRQAMLELYEQLFPTVIGFKLFAGHSTGNMGILDTEAQREIYRQLAGYGYRGILAVHCEKESELHPELWDPSHPESHSLARPAAAELASVKDQVSFAQDAGFSGILHVCHVSHPDTVEYIEEMREKGVTCTISCGITPHHALLNSEAADQRGNLLKMNPPLRDIAAQERIYEMLLSGRIDWIESDHAPHTLADKAAGASGIPGFSGYLHLVRRLISDGIDGDLLRSLTGERFLSLVKYPGDLAITHEVTDDQIAAAAAAYPWDPWDQ